MNGANLELRFVGAGSNQPWFPMRKVAAPIAITFKKDGSVTKSGKLVPGGTALVRYEATRAQCSAGGQDDFIGMYKSGPFMARVEWGSNGPVKGYYTGLVNLPQAHDLALWFHDTGTCDRWDSNFGANFHFPIEH
jgi:hypothetical protein